MSAVVSGTDGERSQPITTELQPNKGRSGSSFLALLDGEWKVMRTTLSTSETRWTLFNVFKDPLDQHDLADQYPTLVNQLRAKVSLWENHLDQLATSFEKASHQQLMDQGYSEEEMELLRSLGYLGYE